MTQRIEGLLNKIPGYTGYRQKESMRDDDRRLREEIARTLNQSIADLSALGARIADERRLDLIAPVEDVIARVRHLESRVRTASYGYGGLFSDRPVDEPALRQLKAFDVAFQSNVQRLVDSIASASSGNGIDPSSMDRLLQEIARLNTIFDARGDVIETAKPANDPDVLALLEQPRVLTPQEQQLLRIRKGGTAAILGENFQFTAHIALASPDGTPVAALVELDYGPEWLAVTDDGRDVRAWRVSTHDSSTPVQTGVQAIADISGPQGSQRGVPATYALRANQEGERTSVQLELSLAGRMRAFEGADQPLIDIQVFSEASRA